MWVLRKEFPQWVDPVTTGQSLFTGKWSADVLHVATILISPDDKHILSQTHTHWSKPRLNRHAYLFPFSIRLVSFEWGCKSLQFLYKGSFKSGFYMILTLWHIRDNRDIMFAWTRWVWTASPGSPTFPVVLSGCQVDGQVNNDEWSPPLRHVDYPHALMYSHYSAHTHTQMNITMVDENAPTVEFWHFTCTTFIWRIIPSFTTFILLLPPPSLHPLSLSLSLFLFCLCVCSLLRPGCLGSHLEIIRIWVAPALLAGLFLQLLADSLTGWLIQLLTR